MDQVAVNVEDGIAILFGDDMRVPNFFKHGLRHGPSCLMNTNG